MNEQYLHPVLTSTGDAVLPQLCIGNNKTSIKRTTKDDFIVTIDLDLNNEFIRRIVDKGEAEYFVQVECEKTRYRRSYHKNDPHFQFPIPRKSVFGRIEIRPSVVVSERLSYCNPSANQDYEGLTFELEKGDTLVEFDGTRFTAELTYSMDNIFKFVANEDPSEKLVKHDFESDKIRIILPKHDYEVFKNNSDNDDNKPMFISSIIMAALIDALHIGEFDQPAKEDDKLWKSSLRYNIENNEDLKNKLSDRQQYYTIAQQLLNNPTSTLFDLIKQMKEKSNDSETI